jgi:hypothetical protein
VLAAEALLRPDYPGNLDELERVVRWAGAAAAAEGAPHIERHHVQVEIA